MREISQVLPIVPVALMSEVLLQNKEKWKSELEIKTQCSVRISQLADAGAPIDISSSALENVLGSAMDAMIGRGLVEEKDNLLRMQQLETDIIKYYANSISHW